MLQFIDMSTIAVVFNSIPQCRCWASGKGKAHSVRLGRRFLPAMLDRLPHLVTTSSIAIAMIPKEELNDHRQMTSNAPRSLPPWASLDIKGCKFPSQA